MTPDQITQLRQLLVEANRHTSKNGGYICCSKRVRECLDAALALLPCPTCNGKGTIFAPKDITGMRVTIPCPDCQ